MIGKTKQQNDDDEEEEHKYGTKRVFKIWLFSHICQPIWWKEMA